MKKGHWLVIIGLMSWIGLTQAENPVHEYTLDNGLKLFVKVDDRMPMVMAQLWYRVGSAHEPRGITGVSHVLEHLLFKGTKKYPAGVAERMISAKGGVQNAFTSADYTGYWAMLPAEHLPFILDLEADRMKNAIFDEDEFASELKVVMEERRWRMDDNPQSLTGERYHAAAHVGSPYHHPVVGWMNDLQNMKLEDAKQWYDTWYAPNNVVIVVVGDVVPETVYQLVKKEFDELESRELPEVNAAEIPFLGTRHVIVKAPAKLPFMIVGYNVPSLQNAQEPWHAYALEMIAHIVDGGSSARFEKELVREEKIAVSVAVGYSLYSLFPSVFSIYGIPTNEYTIEQLQEAIQAQIERLQSTLVSQEELERIKAQVVASKVFALDSLEAQANKIGSLEVRNVSWRKADEYIEKIQSVTPEQIQAVAKLYFIPERLTVAVLEPQSLTDAQE